MTGKWALGFDFPFCKKTVALDHLVDFHEHSGVRFHIEEESFPDGFTSRRLVRSTVGEDFVELAIRVPTQVLRRERL
jgi:hypothetical protein